MISNAINESNKYRNHDKNVPNENIDKLNEKQDEKIDRTKNLHDSRKKKRKQNSKSKFSSRFRDQASKAAILKKETYEALHKNKLQKALKKREKTLEEMFRMETQRTMELFGMDENGSSDFSSFHEIVKNIFIPEELPPEYRNDVDRLILELDEDKSGTLEVDEVNVWFKSIFKGKIQSKGFKRVKELKTMKRIFEIAQDTSRAQNYMLISNADFQLDNFFRTFLLTSELFNSPIEELSDIAPREIDPRKIDQIVHELIEDAILLNNEGRIYFDDLCPWYIQRQGGWSLMDEEENGNNGNKEIEDRQI